MRQRAALAAGTAHKEDTTVGFAEVQALLLGGGFFRAKLNTFLTEFDIIAGGLAWGVLNSRYTIDVQFVENASIKDKIRIAEHICHVLKNDMQCPHDLSPHQIQGLDWPNLAIVIAWLMRRVAAAREDNAYFARQYTKLDWRRKFGSRALVGPPAGYDVEVPGIKPVPQLAEESVLAPKVTGDAPPSDSVVLAATTCLLRDPEHHQQLRRQWANQCLLGAPGGTFRGAPKRVMIGDAQQAMEEVDTTTAAGTLQAGEAEVKRRRMLAHANAVLLEYGENYVVGGAATLSAVTAEAEAHGDELDANDKKDANHERDEEEREQQLLSKLLATMSEHQERAKISAAGLGGVMANTDRKKLQKLREQYETRHHELLAQLAAEEEERNKVERRKEKLTALTEEIALAQPKADKSQRQQDAADAAVAEYQGEFDAAKAEVDTELQAVAEQEAALRAEGDAGGEQAERVREALGIGDAMHKLQSGIELGTAERQRALAEIQQETEDMIGTLEQEEANAEAEDEAEKKEAEQLRGLISELQENEHELACRQLDLQRQLDAYPTPAEIEQYRVRTAELDEEIAWKFEETRLAYAKHNTMAEVRQCLANEQKVMQMIGEQFQNCLVSGSGGKKASKALKQAQDDFREDVQKFVDQLSSSRLQQEQKLAAERAALSAGNEASQQLVQQQKWFADTIESLKAAMAKHKKLVQELKARGLALPSDVATAAEEKKQRFFPDRPFVPYVERTSSPPCSPPA